MGCHAAGGNVVAREKTLSLADLQARGYAGGAAAVAALVERGAGKMPGFGESCAPKGQCTFGKRLSQDEVAALADYVLATARAGTWADVAAA